MQTEVLPTEDEVYRIYKMTQEYLKKAGYKQYEISNYAQPGYECTHNIGYWIRENYLGLGLGAASLMENVRYSNTTDLYTYIENTKHVEPKEFLNLEQEGQAVKGTSLHISAEVVSRKAQMEEFMFLGLRMKNGITRQQFLQTFGIAIEGIYKDVLDKMKQEELLFVEEGEIRLTERGMDLGNYVMSQFLLD